MFIILGRSVHRLRHAEEHIYCHLHIEGHDAAHKDLPQ